MLLFLQRAQAEDCFAADVKNGSALGHSLFSCYAPRVSERDRARNAVSELLDRNLTTERFLNSDLIKSGRLTVQMNQSQAQQIEVQ